MTTRWRGKYAFEEGWPGFLEQDSGGSGSWLLTNSEVDLASGVRQKNVVALKSSQWNLQGAAWHPGPSSRQIYAVMNDEGSLFLVNGFTHRLLAQWTWQQLSGGNLPALASVKEARLIELLWSPDGTQLVVMARGLTALISFGQHSVASSL